MKSGHLVGGSYTGVDSLSMPVPGFRGLTAVPTGIPTGSTGTGLALMLQWLEGMSQRHLRYPIQVPVLYKRLDQEEPAQSGTGWTEDLGEGGACLKLSTALLMGCRLGLVVFAEPEAVEAEARVVWVRAGGQRSFYYHGVEFTYIKPCYCQSLLKALTEGKSAEQREYQRFFLNYPISCQALGPDAPSFEGHIANVSRGGAMIFIPVQLLPQTKVEITLLGPRKYRILGNVRWASDSSDDAGLYSYGIEFLEGPLDAQRFLSLFSDAFSDETSNALATEGGPA